MIKKYDIQEAAEMLNINPQTLRRWDSDKILLARRDSERGHRYYYEDDLADFLSKNYKYLQALAVRWSFAREVFFVPLRFYCQDAYVFKARLYKLEAVLQNDQILKENFSLVTSSVGEIGNNSFDHNIGGWPDVPGIFFGYNLAERKIIISDRGQGVLATLRRARPELANDAEALRAAFTEIISGRAPENRGNGLKYVKKMVQKIGLKLEFYSGKSEVKISGGKEIDIRDSNKEMRGCFAILSY
jgi:hypothetical protein